MSVNISNEFFITLMKLETRIDLLQSLVRKVDINTFELLKELRTQIKSKEYAITKNKLFSDYKNERSADARNLKRQKYLDYVGMPETHITASECPISDI